MSFSYILQCLDFLLNNVLEKYIEIEVFKKQVDLPTFNLFYHPCINFVIMRK